MKMKQLLWGIFFCLMGLNKTWAQAYNIFQPANGILVGSTATYVTTAATFTNVQSLLTGTCNTTTLVFGGGACGFVSLTNNVSGTLQAAQWPGLTGDCTTSSFIVTCLKTNGVSFGTLATQNGTFSGTSSGTNTGDQTAANPTASIGLTAINGSSTSFMRADAAPALSQGIAPTWTGNHIFQSGQYWDQSGAGANLGEWGCFPVGGVFTCATFTDVLGAGVNFLAITRGATTAITDISYGNGTSNNTNTFLGNGITTFNGTVRAIAGTASIPSYSFVGATNYGFNVSSSTLRFEVAGADHALLTSTLFTTVGAIASGGTKFTTSGCSVSSTTGGANAGIFTLGANNCTVIITMNGATGATASNGWTCQVHDRTASTILLGGESSSTATTASITIPVTAGATDVISFNCTGF